MAALFLLLLLPAGAAWALVQLRCPHTFVLSVLSRELLKPEPWMNSKLTLRVKTWHSTPQQQEQQDQQHQQHQQARFLQQLGTEVGLIKSKGSRGVAELDADEWGSLQRPIPKALLQQIRQIGSSSSSSAASRWQRVLQRSSLPDSSSPAAAVGRALQRLLPLGSAITTTSSSSSSSRRGFPSALGPGPSLGHAARGFVHEQHVLDAHPRVRQLGAADVAKLLSSCCLAGWAPPQLLAGRV
jgi:hypothetical protein